MDELEVPDKAVREFDNAILDDRTGIAVGARVPFTGEQYVRAIATPVVVAELRRLLHDETRAGTLAEALRDRIGELEAEQ